MVAGYNDPAHVIRQGSCRTCEDYYVVLNKVY